MQLIKKKIKQVVSINLKKLYLNYGNQYYPNFIYLYRYHPFFKEYIE